MRIYDWGTATMIAERQYRSALIAREFYLEALGNVPQWRLSAVRSAVAYEHALEPPLMEWISAQVYLIQGGESLWVPRFLSLTCWLVGGWFLFRIAQRFAPPPVALGLTAYYLLLPLGVNVSVSFLPDSLMIMLFLASLLTIQRYFERRTGGRLIACSLVSAAAVAVKPLCLFVVLGAFVGMAVHAGRQRRRLVDLHSVVFLICVLVLGTGYYIYGMLLDDYMSVQAQNSFAPRVLFMREFWVGWPLYAGGAVGYTPLILGLLGIPLHRGSQRGLVLGLWVGYVIFCFVFAYHVHITGHYHLQLVPVVALSAAPLVTSLFERGRPWLRSWLSRVALSTAVLLALGFTLFEIHGRFVNRRPFESPEMARQIGALVGHSTRVIFISSYYGVPLEYYGEMAGKSWPRPLRHEAFREPGTGRHTIAERLATLGMTPEYFVITDFAEFESHHRDLALFLNRRCRGLAGSERYLVYDVRDCVRQRS
ncbi:MAG: ArnT family glycosyltransferase [Gemmatimonadota bacterium]